MRGGEIFLLRRDALLLMVQVLERGCGWTQLLCKGLELQETSCHHVEAGTVEEIMDSALGDCTLSSAPPVLPWKNPFTLNTLEPLTKIPATVYSLADTQLTGIIDRTENADQLPRFFARALLWLLRRRKEEKGAAPAAWFDFAFLEEIEGRSLASAPGTNLWDDEWAKAIGLWPPAPQKRVPALAPPPAPIAVGTPAVASPPVPKAVAAPAPKAAAQPPAAANDKPVTVKSGGGFWGSSSKKAAPKAEHTSGDTLSSPTRALAVLPGSTPNAGTGGGKKVEDDMQIDDLDDLLNEFSVAGGNFGSDDLDADALLDELDETLGLSPPRPANQSSSM